LPSAHRTSQDEQTGRRLREQIIIAASQSACILLPNRIPERRLGTRQYRHFNQLSPNSSYQDKVRSKNAYIEEVNTRSRPAIDRVPTKIVLSGTSMSASSGVVEGPARAKETPFAAFWNM
jgi:hypothetical protein